MLGLISYGVATSAFVAGAMVGVGVAGLALMVCRRQRRRDETDPW